MATILVLDDVWEAVKAIQKILNKKGYQTVGFTDEDEAIDYVRSEPVDLAILDIKLRKQSGVHVLNQMKQIRPDLKVIMLTGYPTHETAAESAELGADDYCIKPIDRRKLEEKVRQILS
ncbi:MAG: response regulator [Deltaproteobacteria bacterium]|nr:response regulator [Deltaproteobacteria bacterium]MBW2070553.1 response regulator [Deltaproteobacteria bacterium]